MIHEETTQQAQAALPSHWLMGHLPSFSADPLGSLQRVATTARAPRLRFLNNYAWLAVHPDDIKHVLVDNHANYHKGYGLQALKPVLGEGLLTSEDPLHKQQRRLIQPAFHRKRIEAYATIMSEFTGAHMAHWEAQRQAAPALQLELHDELMHLTMLIVAKCLFDADVSERSDNLGQAISDLVTGYRVNRVGPIGQFLGRFDRAAVRARERNLAVVDAMLYDLIRTRRAENVDRGDLLSMILQATDSEGGDAQSADAHSAGSAQPMNDNLARDELFTLFVAGHETTAIGLTWTFFLLGRHPEIAARLVQELDGALGAPGARLPTLDDLAALPYTRQLFAEAMRLYPPAYATARIAQADDQLGGGAERVTVKKGNSVIVSQYVTHRDPRWWPDPERFDPSRFTPEAEAARPRFAYFPFGGGPRRCIGEQFAWMEAQLILAAIAHRYRVQVDEDYTPVLQPRVTLRPRDGLPVTLIPRA